MHTFITNRHYTKNGYPGYYKDILNHDETLASLSYQDYSIRCISEDYWTKQICFYFRKTESDGRITEIPLKKAFPCTPEPALLEHSMYLMLKDEIDKELDYSVHSVRVNQVEKMSISFDELLYQASLRFLDKISDSVPFRLSMSEHGDALTLYLYYKPMHDKGFPYEEQLFDVVNQLQSEYKK